MIFKNIQLSVKNGSPHLWDLWCEAKFYAFGCDEVYKCFSAKKYKFLKVTVILVHPNTGDLRFFPSFMNHSIYTQELHFQRLFSKRQIVETLVNTNVTSVSQ